MSKHGAKAGKPPSDIEQVIQVLQKHPRNRALPDSAGWEDFKCDLLRVFGGFKKSAHNKPLPRLARQLQFQDDTLATLDEARQRRAPAEKFAGEFSRRLDKQNQVDAAGASSI